MGLFKNKKGAQDEAPMAPLPGMEDEGGKKKGLFGGGKKDKKDKDKITKNPVSAKKKKGGDLLKVLNESVWESVNEDFKMNKQFIIRDGDDVKYVAFLFDTGQVGGLAGKENMRDESKGSIIEAIRTGRIKTYIRTEMLMDNAFIIIPEPDTIDNMDEFNLFHTAKYILCTVTPDGMISTETEGGTQDEDDPEVQVTFEDIVKLIKNDQDVRGLFAGGKQFRPKVHEDSPFDTLLSESGMVARRRPEEDHNYEDDPDPDEDAEPLPDDLADEPGDEDPYGLGGGGSIEGLSGDDGPSDDGLDYGDLPADDYVPQEPAPEPVPEPTYEDVRPKAQQLVPPVQPQPVQQPAYDQQAYAQPQGNYQDSQSNFNFGGDPNMDAGGYDEYAGVSAEVVKDFVVRRFYSDDLGLEISTEPFDAMFLHGNSYLPFNEDRGTGWLNEYLSNIARDANTRMERMHSENLYRMRERYMRLIQAHCTNIAKALDITDDSTQYGRLRFSIEQNRDDNLQTVSQTVSGKREQLEAQWREELDRVGQAAYEQARNAHQEKYGKTHAQDIMRLETLEKDEIERDYSNSIRRLYEERRREASKMLDLSVNETLQEMSAIYLRVLRDEKREYVRLQNEMTRFIDDNRKDEKARIEAMAEENRQTKRANEVRAEFTSKIQSMSAEFDMKKTMLQADIDALNRDHDVEIRRLESEWQGRMKTEKARTVELQQQLDEMMDRFTQLDGQKNEEYKARIAKLEEERDDWSRHTDQIIETHRRSNLVSAMLVISIVIAAIGIGFMVGSIVNVRRTSKIEQDSIYRNVQQGAANGGVILPAGVEVDFDEIEE